MLIAIDGPAGAGKGTLARRLARHYGFHFLDTGALYRAVALTMLLAGEDPQDAPRAEQVARTLKFDFQPVGGDDYHAFINGQDVEATLRTPEVGAAASQVASIPGVRAGLRDFQVNFARKWRSEGSGAVLDGRDIGTVICPDADVKFYLDADPKIRAARRLKEFEAAGKRATLDEVYQQVLERDARDKQREDAPLKPADDAIVIDTGPLTPDAIFTKARTLVDGRRTNLKNPARRVQA